MLAQYLDILFCTVLSQAFSPAKHRSRYDMYKERCPATSEAGGTRLDHIARHLDGLLSPAAVERHVQALLGKGQRLNVNEVIQVNVAVQAVREGYSLTEIVQEAVNRLEKVVIEHVLNVTAGNKAEVARVLRIDYKTLYRKMQKHSGTDRRQICDRAFS